MKALGKILIVVIIILMMGAVGCMGDGKQQALDHMERKYGEEFVMISYGNDMMNSDTFDMTVRPAMHSDSNDWNVTVKRHKFWLTFTDNYVSFLLSEDVEKYLADIVESLFNDAKTQAYPLGKSCPSNFNRKTKVKKAASERGLYACNIFTTKSPDNKDEDEHELKKILDDNKFYNNITLCYLNEKTFEEVAKGKTSEIYEGNKFKYYKFIMRNRELNFIPSVWEKGKQ